LNSAQPHTVNGPCWCKQSVPVMVDGEKVGNAQIDHTGMLVASITSPVLAKKFTEGVTENLSIMTKYKEPEAFVTPTINKF